MPKPFVPKMNDVLLTEYMLAKYRQGHDYVSMYLAATLYERVACNKLRKCNMAKYTEIKSDRDKNNLNNILKALYDQTGLNRKVTIADKDKLLPEILFTHYDYFGVGEARAATDRLFAYKDTRNDIIHSEDPIDFLKNNQNRVMDLMLYVVAENLPDFFRSKLSRLPSHDFSSIGHVIDGKSADYTVRSIDEVMIARYDNSIKTTDIDKWTLTERDFSNLFEMRKKLVKLKNALDEWLEENYKTLQTTILTTIDTASGYIWLPIIHKSCCNNGTDRPNLQNATASILATPLDFRVYIDFGGQCHEERKQYFDFIKNDNNFRRFIKNLHDQNEDNFWVFDVEWYTSIIRQRSIDEILTDWISFDNEIDSSREELSKLITDKIITRNRLLSGFIYNRDWLSLNEEINFDFIKDKLSRIIDLYYDLLIRNKYVKEQNA